MKIIFFVINIIMESYEEYSSNEDENYSREINFSIPINDNPRLRKAQPLEIIAPDTPIIFRYLDPILKKILGTTDLLKLNFEKRISFNDIKFKNHLTFTPMEKVLLSQIFYYLTLLGWALFPEAIGKMKTNEKFISLITEIALVAAPKEIRSFDQISEFFYIYFNISHKSYHINYIY
jgi:hypothetical protein